MKRVHMVLIAVLLMLLSSMGLSGCGYRTEEDGIKKTIDEYYDLAYDSYLELKMKDMSSVLDEDSLWGKNFHIVMDENIRSVKYIMEKGYSDQELKRLPLSVSLGDISIDGDAASVKVNVNGDKTEGYPFFICLGKNSFTLRMEGGVWKIVSVDCHDVLFKKMNIVEFKSVDSDELYNRIDKDYGVAE